ncbi:MAG: hypothetical protein NTW60_03190, partial [Candidatus Wolfebacteria bacterium]|nr:hypothetical protein [Candidatus Wolfebacteria bacterium]
VPHKIGCFQLRQMKFGAGQRSKLWSVADLVIGLLVGGGVIYMIAAALVIMSAKQTGYVPYDPTGLWYAPIRWVFGLLPGGG